MAMLLKETRFGEEAGSEGAASSATPALALPPHAAPRDFVSTHFSPGVYNESEKEKTARVKFSKGTTTLAFIFQGGVIVSVDSRASQGQYISSQTVQKVIEINPYLLGTMAGGAADCLFWQRNLAMSCRIAELRNKERCSVAMASKMLSNTMYNYRGYGLSVGSMVSGWDKTGPHLYYIDSDGTRLEAKPTMPYFSVGSGSTFAYAVLDAGYKHDMSVEEAIDLGKRAIYHATYRDAYSGGVNNVYHVHADGWTKVCSIDVYEHHDKHMQELASA